MDKQTEKQREKQTEKRTEKLTEIQTKRTSLELLAPGGSAAGIRACIAAGADAVYTGGPKFSARAYADNPQEDDLMELIDYCHLFGSRLYLTVNTLLREDELEGQLYDYIEPLYRGGIDAVLVQDLGVLSFLHREFPDLPLHASTQMSVSSVSGARLLSQLGCSRIVPARELTLKELAKIHAQVPVEIETFIHGALCYSYSGQCLMSSMIGGRSGNRGRCAQPCRQPYTLQGKTAYLLSLKDISALEILPELIGAGVISFKIEGRMKRAEYAAGVTSIYRKYLDLYLQNPGNGEWKVDPEDLRDLMDLYNRGGFSRGFYEGTKGPGLMASDRPNHAGTIAAKVETPAGKKKTVTLTALEDLNADDVLEVRDEGGGESAQTVPGRNVRKGKRFTIPAAGAARHLQKGDLLPRVRNERLLQDIRERTDPSQHRIPIRGRLYIEPGKAAELELSVPDGTRVHMCGPVVQKARTVGMSEADFRKQIRKTGDSQFVFEQLEIEMPHPEEAVFCPVSGLNALRREALEKLHASLTGASHRDGPERRAAADGDRCESFGSGNIHITSGAVPGLPVPDQTIVNEEKERAETAGTHETAEAAGAVGTAEAAGAEAAEAAEILLTASAETLEQIEALLHVPEIRRIYVDSLIFQNGRTSPKEAAKEWRNTLKKVRGAGKECFLMLPPVWREESRETFFSIFPLPAGQGPERHESFPDGSKPELRESFPAGQDPESRESSTGGSKPEPRETYPDGLLLRNLQQLGEPVITGSGLSLVTDETVYAWNRRARNLLAQLGAVMDTVPSELNRGQMMHRGIEGSEVPVYGREVLMTTTSCLQKNSVGCRREGAVLRIRDRKGADFPVRCLCGICSNRIYNSAVTSLLPFVQEICKGRPASLRLRFTFETAAETEETARAAAKTLAAAGPAVRTRANPAEKEPRYGSYTRGHYRRGVE